GDGAGQHSYRKENVGKARHCRTPNPLQCPARRRADAEIHDTSPGRNRCAVTRPGRPDHGIQSYLDLLEQADLGDEALRQHIRALKPFVTSLSRIDEDGQELRYHTNRDDDQSLSDYSLANLEVIRDSLGDLSKVISAWKYRTIEFIEDRATNACTEKLSRRDLITIAKILPALARWKGPLFEEKKQQVQTRFNLSSREFCKAIDVIKNNREMKAIVGGETSLLYLPDHLVVWVVEQWRKLHPPRTGSDPGITVVTLDKRAAEAMKDHYCKRSEVVLALQVRLSDQQLAELEVIDSLGRNR